MSSSFSDQGSTPEQEIRWLQTLLTFDRETNWLGRDALDGQGRALALAYTMKALGARHTRDVSTSAYWNPHFDRTVSSTTRSVWVYGFEVDFPNAVFFVGTRGECTHAQAEHAAAREAAGEGMPVSIVSRVWDGKPTAFETLEAARKFYSRDTYAALARLSGEGAAHVRAVHLEASTQAPRPTKPTLPRL